MSIFFLIEKRNYYLLIIIPFIILITLQRYVIISSLTLTILLLLIFNNLSTNSIYLIKIKNFFHFKKVDYLDVIKNKILILLSIIILCIIYVKLISLKGGLFSFFKIIIKFSYFHLHPLEFIYSFYFAYGALFLIFVPYIIIPKLRKDSFCYSIKFQKFNYH